MPCRRTPAQPRPCTGRSGKTPTISGSRYGRRSRSLPATRPARTTRQRQPAGRAAPSATAEAPSPKSPPPKPEPKAEEELEEEPPKEPSEEEETHEGDEA